VFIVRFPVTVVVVYVAASLGNKDEYKDASYVLLARRCSARQRIVKLSLETATRNNAQRNSAQHM